MCKASHSQAGSFVFAHVASRSTIRCLKSALRTVRCEVFEVLSSRAAGSTRRGSSENNISKNRSMALQLTIGYKIIARS